MRPLWKVCEAVVSTDVGRLEKFDENGAKGFGHTALYVQDPASGWTVEYHAPLEIFDASWDVDPGDFDGYCMYHCA